MLHIEITSTGGRLRPRSDDVLRAIRQRLAALYGGRATLAVARIDETVLRLELEIPHEPADGDHR
jgi:hypothetical protein